jgi:nitrite reductase (NADH) small subunit
MALPEPPDDAFEAVATTGDLAPNQLKRVEYRGQPVCLVHANGRYYALSNVCAHQNIALSMGRLFRGQLVCPGHAWMYDLETGRVTFPKGIDARVRCYAVRVVGEQILIAPRPEPGGGAAPPS